MWLITKDYIDNDNRTIQSADFNANIFAKAKHVQFKVYDDDGELYYRGLMSEKQFDTCDKVFEPLDWAAYDSGCTAMQYKRLHGNWEVL